MGCKVLRARDGVGRDGRRRVSRRSHDNSKEHLRQQARQLILQRKTAEETENWLRRLRAEAFVEIRLGE